MAKTRKGAAFAAVIDNAEKIFYRTAFDVLDAIAYEKVDQARTAARKMGSEFFRTLAKDYMKVEAPGPFGKWAKLNPEWENYKNSKLRGSGSKIYYGISPQKGLGRHLRQEMAQKNANRLFGAPKIRVKAASDQTGVQGKIVPNEKLFGRFQFASGSTKTLPDGSVRKIGGQFVTPSARVTVELFPKVVGLTSPEIFDAMQKRSPDVGGSSEGDGGRGNWIERLAGNEFGTALGGKVPARPLLAPFMEWWLQNTAYRRIEEALR